MEINLQVNEGLVGQATIWQSCSWARDWFDDAFDAAKQADHRARRREIIFSVCFAETYLFECVRDEILKRDFVKLATYFPFGKKRGVDEKWREVPKALYKDGLIGQKTNFGGSHGIEWLMLIKYRDGFTHASASRPSTASQPAEQEPLPSKAAIDQLKPGWALRVVNERIRIFHAAIPLLVPGWIVDF